MKIIIFRVLLLSFLFSSIVMAADEAQLPPEPGAAAASAVREANAAVIPSMGLAAAALIIAPTEVFQVGAFIAVYDSVIQDYR